MKNHPLTTLFDFGGDEVLDKYDIYGFSGASSEKCSVCGRSKIRPTFRDNIRCKIKRLKINYWPDFISGMTPIVSGRVAETLKSESGGFRTHPVNVIVEQWEGPEALGAPPPYYAIEALGEVELNRDELDESGGKVCPECFRREPAKDDPYRFGAKRMWVRIETWTGEDFVRISNVGYGFQLCSWKVVDLALRESWTHAKFGRMVPGVLIQGEDDYDPQWRDRQAEALSKRMAKD